MNAEAKPSYVPNLAFSHFGMATTNMDAMVDFYTRVLGFTQTDEGEVLGGMKLIFLSRDPQDHHQIVLVSGRPDNLPANPYHPQYGSVINQISFKMGSFQGLRELFYILKRENVQSIFPANHGIAWSIYCHDPDGNNLEFFVDSDWYCQQPCLEQLDFDAKTNEEILAETEALARSLPGFEPYPDWRKRFGARMNLFKPGQ